MPLLATGRSYYTRQIGGEKPDKEASYWSSRIVGDWVQDWQLYLVKLLSVSKPQEKPQIHRSISGWLKGKKMDYKIGTWNTWTLFKVAMKSLVHQLLTNKVKTAAVQETRWTGREEMWDTKSHTIFSSGKMRSSNKGGISFVVDTSEKSNILKLTLSIVGWPHYEWIQNFTIWQLSMPAPQWKVSMSWQRINFIMNLNNIRIWYQQMIQR